jgi:tetratricopeptide (TPR) repeat protein
LPEDDVLVAIEEAERAHLVEPDVQQRTPRYGFVHELIRSTLIGDLSLPRRQRLHLRIADALERLRAASLDSHASVLAHHLYQAGAAVDGHRAANALIAAGTRALDAGAFEEALEAFDNLLSLELPEEDPIVATATEHRGRALASLGRFEESVAAYDRALMLLTALEDHAGVRRTALALGATYAWRGRFREGLVVFRRGLAISQEASPERAQLLAWYAAGSSTPAEVENGARLIEEARQMAVTAGDRATSVRVLVALGAFQRECGELVAAGETLRHARDIVSPGAVWDLTDIVAQLLVTEYYFGHFASCDELAADLRGVAQRAGHGGGLFMAEWMPSWVRLCREGDLRGQLDRMRRLGELPQFSFLSLLGTAVTQLYLGQLDAAFEGLARSVDDVPESYFSGLAEGNLFNAYALAAEHERARAAMPAAAARLPVAGRRSIQGAFFALDAYIAGLTHLGLRDECAALYPLALEYVKTGHVVVGIVVGPSTPELAAALAADAAGLVEPARAHFEVALRQSRDVPIRLLEPMVLYCYGRSLASAASTADQARGRAMVEAALEGFRRFEMTPHVTLAERFLHR